MDPRSVACRFRARQAKPGGPRQPGGICSPLRGQSFSRLSGGRLVSGHICLASSRARHVGRALFPCNRASRLAYRRSWRREIEPTLLGGLTFSGIEASLFWVIGLSTIIRQPNAMSAAGSPPVAAAGGHRPVSACARTSPGRRCSAAPQRAQPPNRAGRPRRRARTPGQASMTGAG